MSAPICSVFVGPTLYGDACGPLRIPENVRLLPPAGRGDIAALTRGEPPGILALVDGLFHMRLAVGHEELRSAVQAGWQVWGLASLGAIRAYEMRTLGMRGFGQVYARFEAETDFQDDEVALLHAPDPPYRAASEPLVHLRAALETMESLGLLTAPAHVCVQPLKSLWYGDRTLHRFHDLVMQHSASISHNTVREFLTEFAPYRLKTRDLETFFRLQPWRSAESADVSARNVV